MAADDRPACPSCGRDAVATAQGLCIYCLEPLPAHASRVEPIKILRLSEFERVRDQERSRGAERRLRTWGAVGAGVLAAGIVVVIFALCMRWLMAVLGRGLEVSR